MLARVFEARFGRADVLINDGLALVAESIGKHAGDGLKFEAGEEHQRAQGHGVLHNRGHGTQPA